MTILGLKTPIPGMFINRYQYDTFKKEIKAVFLNRRMEAANNRYTGIPQGSGQIIGL
jgi:hypothetical protein